MYVGIDCGTQGTKVVILDPEKAMIVGEGYSAHALTSHANGCREQDPQWWVDALVASYHIAVDQAGIHTSAIKAIGVSGQQHGMVVLNQAGDVIRPAKLWCDTQTAAQNAQLLEQLGGESGCLERLGVVVQTGYTLSKLLWLKQQEPESFQQIAHILLPHDYLNYWLTGEYATEYGDASGTGYFDIRTRQWLPDVLALVDDSGRLATALPTLLSAEQAVGTVRHSVAQLLGLGSNVIVSSGGGDNMMGAIGTGNIQEGILTMSLGTSGAVYGCSSAPPSTPDPLLAAFCSSSNDWLPLICTMNLTATVNTVRNMFDLDLADFNRQAASAPIGANGITLLPFFSGERVPALPEATGTMLGLNMQNMSAANLCRAVMEGTSFGLRYGLDLLRATGVKSDQIRLIGGGSKSLLWRQMIADMMDAPVVCPTIGEAGALGAAIQALWCEQSHRVSLAELCQRYVQLDNASAVLPNPESVAAYHQAYHSYRQAITQVYV